MSNKRQFQADLERCEFKLKQANEESQKCQLHCEKTKAELHQIASEKTSWEASLKSRDSLIDSLQKQVTSVKDECRQV